MTTQIGAVKETKRKGKDKMFTLTKGHALNGGGVTSLQTQPADAATGRQTDGWTDGRTDGRTDRQTDRQTDGQS